MLSFCILDSLTGGDLQLSGPCFTIRKMLRGDILINRSGKCRLSKEGLYCMQESKT